MLSKSTLMKMLARGSVGKERKGMFLFPLLYNAAQPKRVWVALVILYLCTFYIFPRLNFYIFYIISAFSEINSCNKLHTAAIGDSVYSGLAVFIFILLTI